MQNASTKPETVTRETAIDTLRRELVKVAGDHSICKVAGEKNIFCRGFNRFSDAELRRAFAWIERKRPGMPRQKLEELADCWQLARQDVGEEVIACDVQQKEHDSCRGWDDFTNEELSRFLKEVTGRAICVLSC
jgi:hypothetical protein